MKIPLQKRLPTLPPYGFYKAQLKGHLLHDLSPEKPHLEYISPLSPDISTLLMSTLDFFHIVSFRIAIYEHIIFISVKM